MSFALPLFNSVISWLLKKRVHQIELFMKYPEEVQSEWFIKLVSTAKDTEWGRKYDFKSIRTMEHFKERVPVSSYEEMQPFIDRLRKGEQNILWPSDIRWFAKSSGTTSSKSKFIPVSQEALDECHYKGGKDMLALYCNNNPETRLFEGKSIGMTGHFSIDDLDAGTYYGDVSAILVKNLPYLVELIRTPDKSIALMDEWEDKIEQMARQTIHENVTNIAGVPSWTLLLLKHVLEITGKDNLKEVWPNFELYIHGGVNFSPYRENFKKIAPPDLNYLQTYNASEGFFGIQDRLGEDDMLLMLDYGIFYEFMPMEEVGKSFPKTLILDQVETGTNYALIISTNAGLWRYLIGDTIEFTSLRPYRIRVTGRTKNFINAFGEELIVDNAERALAIACEKTKSVITEYTAAPVYFNDNANAAHEWLIEFEVAPENPEYFVEMFDNALKSLNSDYEAKRYHDMILRKPVLRMLPKDTFYHWLKTKGRLGGQYKVPRLSNNREYVEEILALSKTA